MKKRLIAYYLPQFHEVPENNEWWGKGYTEWTAINNWKPYFKNHSLRKPTESLGYYDLSNNHILEKQYKIASKYGIEGFCFWIYWFGNGERLLEMPLKHLLSQKNNIKYCFAWANHSWWDKSKWRLLKEQKYLGKDDYIRFYKELSDHFNNPNYIKKDNKLLLSIFMPRDIPDIEVFMQTLNELAKEDGFDGFYFISDQSIDTPTIKKQFDGYMCNHTFFKNRSLYQKIIDRLVRLHSWDFLGPIKYSYPKLMKDLYIQEKKNSKFIPTIFPGWDSTPRHKKRGVVLYDFNEKTFEKHVNHIYNLKTSNEFIFIKSWNEWAEGNILEPDSIYGYKLLEIIKKYNQKN